MTDEETITITEHSTDDLPKEFHSIIKEYGRSMYATLINTGVAEEAAAALNQCLPQLPIIVQAQAQQALIQFLQAFNQLSTAYTTEMKWEEERMKSCKEEIEAVLKTKFTMPESVIVGTDGQKIH